jgi:adenylate kinase family enzyme
VFVHEPAEKARCAPRRILIAGVTGVGKTTLAARVGVILDIPHTEIDALYHGPGWVPRAAFESDVDAFTREPAWVTEWQYSQVRPLLAGRADLLVWLDLPARVALWRLVVRTVRRRRKRVELWNGNVEPPLTRMLVDRDHIIWWGLRTQRRLKRLVPRLAREYPHLRIVRLSSQRETDAWLERLERLAGTHG